jgi:hypothetical protein
VHSEYQHIPDYQHCVAMRASVFRDSVPCYTTAANRVAVSVSGNKVF